MSSPVSPRQRDIGEVASLRAEGVDPSAAKRLFCKLAKLQRCFLPNPSACGTSPIRAIARQRRTLLRIPTAYNRIFASITNLSTINPKL